MKNIVHAKVYIGDEFIGEVSSVETKYVKETNKVEVTIYVETKETNNLPIPPPVRLV